MNETFADKLKAADAAILELLARIDLLEEANEGAHAVIHETESQRDRLRDLLCKLFRWEVVGDWRRPSLMSQVENAGTLAHPFTPYEVRLLERLEAGECDA